jgi:hypothetical protein
MTSTSVRLLGVGVNVTLTPRSIFSIERITNEVYTASA